MSRLNEETTVPFFWLVAAFIFACGGAWSTAYFAFNVTNDIHVLKQDVRLIKRKMNIPESESEAKRELGSVIREAEAHQ